MRHAPALTALAVTAAVAPAAAVAEPAREASVAVAPRLGLVAPTSKLGLMVIGGVQVDVATPALERRLRIGLDLSLTRPAHDGAVMDPRLPGEATYEVRETELVAAVLATYRLAGADRALVPWVAAGPMLHVLRTSESTSIAPGDNTEASAELGVELAGGVDFRAGPGYVGGDLRAAYSRLDHALTGATNAGTIAVTASYRVLF